MIVRETYLNSTQMLHKSWGYLYGIALDRIEVTTTYCAEFVLFGETEFKVSSDSEHATVDTKLITRVQPTQAGDSSRRVSVITNLMLDIRLSLARGWMLVGGRFQSLEIANQLTSAHPAGDTVTYGRSVEALSCWFDIFFWKQTNNRSASKLSPGIHLCHIKFVEWEVPCRWFASDRWNFPLLEFHSPVQTFIRLFFL